jgi:hypothetical protein
VATRSQKEVKRRHVRNQGEAQQHKCCFCRIPMWYQCRGESGIPDDMATYEHIIPVSHGSAGYTRHNCLVSCYRCNALRGTEDVYVFASRVALFGREHLKNQRRAAASISKKDRQRKRKARARRQKVLDMRLQVCQQSPLPTHNTKPFWQRWAGLFAKLAGLFGRAARS